MSSHPVSADFVSESAEIESLLAALESLRQEIVNAPLSAPALLEGVHQNFRDSARNLLHYLTLRRRDLRSLQLRLATLGLSSLGRAESHVESTIDAVLHALRALSRGAGAPGEPERQAIDFAHGTRLLAEHTDALFGPATANRHVRIMVTMPSEAAVDYLLVHNLLQQGMDCMRINCAHDDANAWEKMIAHLRRAEQALGRRCRVVMDLAGPKLRTGPIEPGPAVVRIRPQRDAFGRVTEPARIWLTSDESPALPPTPADATLTVPGPWLDALHPGERLKLQDVRNARRKLRVLDVTGQGAWVEALETSYIVEGTVLCRSDEAGSSSQREARIGPVPPGESFIELRLGDRLVLTRDLVPGRPATHDRTGRVLTPATIGCTIPEVFEDIRPGDAIWFDDGKIGGVIEHVEFHQAGIRITQARERGERLKADKGINLPDTNLRLGAMTAKDREDLPFVAQHADVVELSFANTARDVEQLQQQLTRLGNRHPAIVLKIETRRGFENLPDMLLAAMRTPCCGVMIARGDLAVECGFERLAEVQEEILWICEAAHVPVIWATQVLETLAKDGLPSRAEITDAAMGDRAECVMLNKGPHVVSAVRVLDGILSRMQAHHAKKRSMLRELRLAHSLTPQSHAATHHESRIDAAPAPDIAQTSAR